MFNAIFYFIFLHIKLILSQRSDYYSVGHMIPNMAEFQGVWTQYYNCSSGWATSYMVFYDCDWYGLQIIRLYCSDWKGNGVSMIDYSIDPRFTGSWTDIKSCSSGGYINSYNAYGCCCPHVNNIAINNIEFYCSTGDTLLALTTSCGDGDTYGWGTVNGSCAAGSAICGLQLRFDNYTETDSTALNDVYFSCCRICNPKSSVFYSGIACNACNLDCLTCTTSAATCDSCGGADTLTANQCVQDPTSFTVSEEFQIESMITNTLYSNGGWSGGYSSYVCNNALNSWLMIGNYGTNVQNKTLTNLLPHYKARIKTRFYKINAWVSGESVQISIDNTALSVSQLTSWLNTDAFYYGDICDGGGGSGNEDMFFVDQDFTHSSTSMVISYSGIVGTGKYWGISHVGVYVYRCDSTCLTCNGPASNQCLTCYTYATLSSSNTCSCNNLYYATTTTNCVTSPCTVCNSCYTGCLICTDGTSTSCTSCLTNYYLYNNQCYSICPTSPALFGDQSSLTCIVSCASDQYYDNNRVCQTCNSICYTCFGSGTNCISCTGSRYLEGNTCTTFCPLGYYGVSSSQECLSDCDDYYFQNDADRLCYLNCPSGSYGNVQTKKCTSTCPSGTYGDPTTLRCEYCNFNCLTCAGDATNCGTCKYSWLTGTSCANPTYTNTIENQAPSTNPMTNSAITTAGFVVNGVSTTNDANSCSSYYVLGGPGTLGSGSSIEKQYTGLVPHFRARVTFFFLKIDNWINDNVYVLVDGVSLSLSLQFTSLNDSSVMKLCGNPANTEAVRPVDLSFNHTSPTLSLSISTNLTSAASIASWGIYDLTVTIDICNPLYCLTCDQASPADCLSCIAGLYLQSNPPSLCHSLCAEGYYTDSTTGLCAQCNVACDSCSGPSANECLSCPIGTYLLNSACVSSCPSTSFPSSDGLCTQCDSTCATCNGASPTNCLTCSLPLYLSENICYQKCPATSGGDNSTATCLDQCPVNTFLYNLTNICTPCSNCKTCSGFGSNQCTSCNMGYLYQDGTCVSACSPENFINVANKSCSSCVPQCSVCASLATCSTCSTNYFLVVPQNVSCSQCVAPGQIQDPVNQVCGKCINQCISCSTLTTCDVCADGYYMTSLQICGLQINLEAELTSTVNAQVLNLLFTECWSSYFLQISNYMNIVIQGISSSSYSYSISNKVNTSLVIITFSFEVDIKLGTWVNLTLNSTDDPNGEFLLLNKTFSIALNPYCVPPYTYLKTISGCVKINYLTPTLKTTPLSTRLQLSFSQNYGQLYQQYYNLSTCSIKGVDPLLYNFAISWFESTPDIFYITLNFSTSIENNPTLTFYLNPPDSILYDSTSSLQVTTTKLQTSLLDYYLLDAATQSLVDSTQSGTEGLNQAAGDAFACNNLMMGSSFGIKSVVSMESIKFLRYFLIDYPPSVIAMYQTSMPSSDYIPEVKIDENPADGTLPDIFEQYDMSIYAFNNTGNVLIEILVYVLVGLVFLVLIKISKKTKNRHFRIFTLILRLIFVWNYAVSSFLSQFMAFNLSTFLAYRYPTTKTPMGCFNVFYSVLTGFLIIGSYVLCFDMIAKLRPLLCSQSIKEFEEEVLKKGNKHQTLNTSKTPARISSKGEISQQSISPLKSLEYSNIALHDNFSPLTPKKANDQVGSKGEKLTMDKSKYSDDLVSPKPVTFKKIDFESLGDSQKHNQKLSNNRTSNATLAIEMESASTMFFSKKTALNRENTKKVQNIEETKTEEHSTKQMQHIPQKCWAGIFLKISAIARKNTFFNRMLTKIEAFFNQNIESIQNENEEKRGELNKIEKQLELLSRTFYPLHKDYNHIWFASSYYIVLDLLRQTLFSLLVVTTFDQPFEGLIMVNVINIIFMVFFLTVRPFKKRIDFIQNLINDFCLLISSLAALVMASMEKIHYVDQDTKMGLGWLMVMVNGFLIMLFLLRIVYNIVIMAFAVTRIIIPALWKKITNRAKIQPKIMVAKPDGEEKKEDDHIVLEQIIEIEGFLKG